MMRPYALFAFALMPAIVAASRCCPANAEPAGDDPVLAAWAQLIPHAGCTTAQERRPVNACDPELVIRAVVRPGTTCPEIRISGDENLLTMAERPNPAKDDIEVRVCEASVERRKAGQASLTNSRKTVSWSAFVRSDALDRVVVIGDTGCRNEQGQEGCDASGGEEGTAGRGWPFARVADVAAKTKPGLVIHVGDFRYRHGSEPDKWKDWKKDVFDPAAPLLAAAPWVIARGNHDLCFKTKGGYKGNGWPLFFGPKLGDNPKNCRETADARAAAPPPLPPYALDVMPELRLVVLDSSGSYYGCAEWGRAFDDWARGGFADLFRPGGQDKADPQTGKADQRRVWLVTHYPVWHLEEKPDSPCKAGEKKQGHDALREKLAPFLLNSDNRVDAVLAGDIHHFEVLQVVLPNGTSVGPTEYVAGHGGALPTPLPTTPELACDPNRPRVFDIRKELPPRREFIGEIEATSQPVTLRGRVICGHGFLGIERRGHDWHFTAKFVDAGSSPPAVFSIPAKLDGLPPKPQLVLTGFFDADVSRLKPTGLAGWRVVGGTDGVAVGKIALLACRPGDRKVDAIVTLDEPPSYAAVPVSALRRIGADVIAVAGRTGDQIKTEFKAQGDFTPFGTDKSLAELGETCR